MKHFLILEDFGPFKAGDLSFGEFDVITTGVARINHIGQGYTAAPHRFIKEVELKKGDKLIYTYSSNVYNHYPVGTEVAILEVNGSLVVVSDLDGRKYECAIERFRLSDNERKDKDEFIKCTCDIMDLMRVGCKCGAI